MDLSDPYLKTARAKEHLEALKTELTTYYESKPCEFLGQRDLTNQRYRVRIKITDPPDRLSLIFGDVVGCLRASLDHLVWCLATSSGTYAKDTSFPIFEKVNDKLFRKRLTGVPADAVTVIESLQPYHGRDTAAIRSHLLWRLNKLCNIDKHARVPLHGSVVDFKLPDTVAPHATFDSDGIMSFPLALESQVKLYPTAAFNVTFGDSFWGVECDREGLERIYEFVANSVIPRFTRFFK